MVRLWDLIAGKTLSTLTHHKKAIRALTLHPTQFMMATGSADNIKQWKLRRGWKQATKQNMFKNTKNADNKNKIVEIY